MYVFGLRLRWYNWRHPPRCLQCHKRMKFEEVLLCDNCKTEVRVIKAPTANIFIASDESLKVEAAYEKEYPQQS